MAVHTCAVVYGRAHKYGGTKKLLGQDPAGVTRPLLQWIHEQLPHEAPPYRISKPFIVGGIAWYAVSRACYNRGHTMRHPCPKHLP